LLTQNLKRLRDGRIGVLCQIDPAGTAILQRLSELLGAYDHLGAGLRQGTSIRIVFQIMRFHTSLYYTQIFQKVNKFCKFF